MDGGENEWMNGWMVDGVRYDDKRDTAAASAPRAHIWCEGDR